jgi:hypothetical protein
VKASETQKIFESHIESYTASKLSKAGYCKANNLHYHQFNYWLKKKPKQSAVLVPVKIQPSIEQNSLYTDKFPKVLCTLAFGRSGCLKIYDVQVIVSILERIL